MTIGDIFLGVLAAGMLAAALHSFRAARRLRRAGRVPPISPRRLVTLLLYTATFCAVGFLPLLITAGELLSVQQGGRFSPRAHAMSFVAAGLGLSCLMLTMAVCLILNFRHQNRTTQQLESTISTDRPPNGDS